MQLLSLSLSLSLSSSVLNDQLTSDGIAEMRSYDGTESLIRLTRIWHYSARLLRCIGVHQRCTSDSQFILYSLATPQPAVKVVGYAYAN